MDRDEGKGFDRDAAIRAREHRQRAENARTATTGADTAAESPRRANGSDRFGFDVALVYLRQGEKVARLGWNGPGQYIQMRKPHEESDMTLPYLYIHTVQRDLVPWLASQTDLLAFDWCLVSERTVLVYGDERQHARAGNAPSLRDG